MLMRILSAASLLLSSINLTAMSCMPMTVKEAAANADVIFRGTIVGIHDAKTDALTQVLQPRKIILVFRVSRAWKGPVTAKFELAVVQDNLRPAGSDQFWTRFLVVGNDLLVYGFRSKQTGEYMSHPCSHTSLARDSKDFLYLGPGSMPQARTAAGLVQH